MLIDILSECCVGEGLPGDQQLQGGRAGPSSPSHFTAPAKVQDNQGAAPASEIRHLSEDRGVTILAWVVSPRGEQET